MERNKKFVYLGTENNPKSCLGLKEIMEDGWNVVLVVAYINSPRSATNKTSIADIKSRVISYLKNKTYIYNFLARARGRKAINYPNMREISSNYNILYVSTYDKTLTSLKRKIQNLSPDVILSNGWQFKVTEDVFSLAKLISLNCHSSYLPEYRGGNITYAPLINEERQSGVTVHQLVKKFDAGSILAQKRVQIDRAETPYSLNFKRAQVTGEVLRKALYVAGHEELYTANPPSPFYYRCDYKTYIHYKRLNFFRKLLGLPIKKYKPRDRYDI